MTPRTGRFVKGISIVAAACILMGCAAGQTSGQPLMMDDKSLVVFYVAHQPKDGRDLHLTIANNLTQRGYRATSGKAGDEPPTATHLVSYIDHWAWDMRMFLADLRLEVRDPETGAILAYGQSVQNSLKAMGWTHDDVIELAVAEMLGEIPTAPGGE